MKQVLFPVEFLRLLEGMSLVGGHVPGCRRPGAHRTPLTGESQEFQDFRSYTPGDDMRYLDWNVFRRIHKLVLRRYRRFPDADHVITLDSSNSVRFSWQRAATAWRIAALLGAGLLGGGDRVMLRCAAERTRVFQPGSDALWRWCEALRELFDQPPADAELGLQRRWPGTHWVISDFYDRRGLEFLAGSLAHAAFIPIRIFDAEEENPCINGNDCLVDSESRERIPVSENPALLTRYRQQLERFESILRQSAQRCGARLIRIPTTPDVHVLYATGIRELAEVGS